MNKKVILLIITLNFQCTCLLAQISIDSKIREARASIISLIEEENIVGLSITVSHHDSIVWSEGFGYSDLQGKNAIEPDKTLFRIASISKPITSAILGRLYEENTLDYNESVYKYVPNFPRKKFDINLLHLATHTAGIRHYNIFERDNTKPMSIAEGLKKFKNSKLKFKPGTDYLYSSYGYNLLGVAMEQASKLSFEELLKVYVTQPLGMKNTMPDKGSYDRLQVSGFFLSKKNKKVKEAQPVYMATILPSGGMLSTSEDLVTFGNAYAYNKLLRDSTQNKILTQTVLPNGKEIRNGIGWSVKIDQKGRKIISQTGGNTGSVCRLIVYPESKLTVAVVSNTFGIDWLKFVRTVNHIPDFLLSEQEK